MKRWKVYYTDGTTFDSDQGGPLEAPRKTVAVIVSEDGRCGRRMLHGTDWYRWLPEYERWGECREFDILHEVASTGTVCALRGGYMGESAFEKILISAHEDTFVPKISPKTHAHEAWSA